MTTATRTSSRRANLAQRRSTAALQFGGPLYGELEELVARAETVALDALGITVDDPVDAGWSFDREDVVEDVAFRIGEAMFQSAMEFLAAAPPDGLTPQARQALEALAADVVDEALEDRES